MENPCKSCPLTRNPQDDMYCPGEQMTCVKYVEWRAAYNDVFIETSAEEEQ